MLWNFPEINTTRTEDEQVTKILDEIKEFKDEPSNEECVDILHAIETLIRIRFKNNYSLLRNVIFDTIEKNKNRGYYHKQIF